MAYCFGTREHKYLDELRALLAPFRISIVYCDENGAYKTHITESIVTPGKRNTQCVERKHLSLRTCVVGLSEGELGFLSRLLCIKLLLVWL